MTRPTLSPLMAALSAVTESLRRCGITLIRLSPASALHHLEFELNGEIIAAVSFADGMFVDDDIPLDVAALVRATAHLACAAPPVPVPVVPRCSPTCIGEHSHPFLEA